MNPFDHYLKLLHKDGWSLGSVRVATYNGYKWVITASKGNKELIEIRDTETEALEKITKAVPAIEALDPR